MTAEEAWKDLETVSEENKAMLDAQDKEWDAIEGPILARLSQEREAFKKRWQEVREDLRNRESKAHRVIISAANSQRDPKLKVWRVVDFICGKQKEIVVCSQTKAAACALLSNHGIRYSKPKDLTETGNWTALWVASRQGVWYSDLNHAHKPSDFTEL